MNEIERGRGLCPTLWVLGVASALSLLAAPLEALQPPTLVMPWWAFRALALVNPILFLSVAVAAGCWASRRVGLEAPVVAALLARAPAGPVLRRQLLPAVLAGLATAAVLGAYGVLTAPLFAAAPKLPELAMPLLTKLLYGGVVEELMMRWGVMSLAVWAAWKLSRRPTPGTGAFFAGIAVAALLFAVGHLPVLFTLWAQPPGTLVAAVIVGNAIPGALFGWLFWQRGLEAAMLAHALGHLLFVVVSGG